MSNFSCAIIFNCIYNLSVELLALRVFSKVFLFLFIFLCYPYFGTFFLHMVSVSKYPSSFLTWIYMEMESKRKNYKYMGTFLRGSHTKQSGKGK